MTSDVREQRSSQIQPAEIDFGWSLGVLLRGYRNLTAEAIGDFPHGVRGYQALFTVVHRDQPNQLALASYLGIDRTVMPERLGYRTQFKRIHFYIPSTDDGICRHAGFERPVII